MNQTEGSLLPPYWLLGGSEFNVYQTTKQQQPNLML